MFSFSILKITLIRPSNHIKIRLTLTRFSSSSVETTSCLWEQSLFGIVVHEHRIRQLWILILLSLHHHLQVGTLQISAISSIIFDKWTCFSRLWQGLKQLLSLILLLILILVALTKTIEISQTIVIKWIWRSIPAVTQVFLWSLTVLFFAQSFELATAPRDLKIGY